LDGQQLVTNSFSVTQGKTAMVTDLANSLGQQCIVLSCTAATEQFALATLLQGAAGSGTWACFDNIDRLELQRLSVLAQQLADIQFAVCSGAASITIEGSNLALRHSNRTFATFNAGQSPSPLLPGRCHVRGSRSSVEFPQ
jgi:dynein heavy chain, axonemal